MVPCDDLLGLTEPELVRRLGPESSRRSAGGDTWLVFASSSLSLRVRMAGPEVRVASWTASFEAGFELLSEAAGAVGLWPAAAPEERASGVTEPLVRRALPGPGSGTAHSLTATVRHGRFTAVSVFDEAPDWL